MRIDKFGGTSVGCAERMRSVADIVRAAPDRDMVVVVSALSGVTSALIGGARAAALGDADHYGTLHAQLVQRHRQMATELLSGSAELPLLLEEIDRLLAGFAGLCGAIALLGELTMRGHDAVGSIGEELSSRMLAALLRTQGRAAQAVSATELIETDANFGAALPNLGSTRQRSRARLLPLLEQGILPIVTGYKGATPEGITTTLGRGGSDYTAAIMGVALDADQVCIWTDVDGILTADPKLVPHAHTLPELSYAEAEELAFFGANVLHPKTVAPLARAGIDLRVLNSFRPENPGTLIVSHPVAGRHVLPAIISTEHLSLVEVTGNGLGWSLVFASRALQALAEAGVEVYMFSQAFSERSLNLVIPSHDQAHGLRILQHALERELQSGQISRIGIEEQVAAISVVGMPDLAGAPIVPRAFAALGKLGIRVVSVAQASSRYSVSFIIAEADVVRAVPYIHAELGL